MRTRARTRARRGAQVDVNGDEKMEWSELTSYIVESHTGMGRALPTYTAVPPVPDQSTAVLVNTVLPLLLHEHPGDGPVQ